MKKSLCLLTTAAVCAGSSAHAQGLLSIGGRGDEFAQRIPFSITVGVGAGWDSNVNLSHDNEQDSAFIQGAIMLNYNTGDRRTSYSVGVEYSPFYYFDAAEGMEDFLHDASIGFSFAHRVNSRLTVSDNLYFAYEFQPDYNIGASVSRRADQYLYGYNNLAVSYAWTKRFSTVSSYTFSGIEYLDSSELVGESHLNHLIGQEFRYAFTPRTTGALTYRFGVGLYDNDRFDYKSHYILAGLDHQFDRRTTGSFRVGAEIRDRDTGGTETNPYFEGSLTHSVSRQTNFRAYARVGFEDADVSSYTERYSYRLGASLDQRINSRLAFTGGFHYIHDEFEGGRNPFDENVFALNVGLDYNVYRNLVLSTGYAFTISDSDNEFREYDRHLLTVGLSASF